MMTCVRGRGSREQETDGDIVSFPPTDLLISGKRRRIIWLVISKMHNNMGKMKNGVKVFNFEQRFLTGFLPKKYKPCILSHCRRTVDVGNEFKEDDDDE